jgi:hypothetical protein
LQIRAQKHWYIKIQTIKEKNALIHLMNKEENGERERERERERDEKLHVCLKSNILVCAHLTGPTSFL